jgi:hypothetical protein
VKAITVYRPWSSFIVFRLKSIETRTHDRFRSLIGERIAIHAGKTWDREFVDLLPEKLLYSPAVIEALKHAKETRGCVIGTAYVNSARWLTHSDNKAAMCPAAGRFGMSLGRVERLREPVPAKGHQGIWTWKPEEPSVEESRQGKLFS